MADSPTSAPPRYIEMHAAGASAHEVWSEAYSDGYNTLDSSLIVAGLFGLSFHEARQIGYLIYKKSSSQPE